MNLNVAIPQQLDLTSSKLELIEKANEFVRQLIEDGGDGVSLLAQAAKLHLVADAMIVAAKTGVLEDVRPYGREGVNRYGVSLTVKESGVKYDYTLNPTWQNLNAEVVKATKARTAHETYLKALPYEGRIYVCDNTGETFRAYPPAKKAGETVFVEIK